MPRTKCLLREQLTKHTTGCGLRHRGRQRLFGGRFFVQRRPGDVQRLCCHDHHERLRNRRFRRFFPLHGGGGENGLELIYSANTGNLANSAADVGWTYSVSGTPSLEDAFASFSGTPTGTGSASLAETLSNGAALGLIGPGSTSTTFAPIPSLAVLTDQNNFSGPAGSAETSILQNGFSVTPPPVPEPSTWVMMALGFGLMGLLGYRKTRSALA
jgi:PEP-CTERM motif